MISSAASGQMTGLGSWLQWVEPPHPHPPGLGTRNCARTPLTFRFVV